MNRNLGATSLRRRKRPGDPMRNYDSLPAPLRHWVAQAVLPWSAASVRKIWASACARGLNTQEALQALSRAEQCTLARDHHRLIP